MIVLDASGLFAAFDEDQPEHAACRGVLEADAGPLLLSPFVLAELDYFIARRGSVQAELRMLQEVATGVYRLEPFSMEDVGLASAIVTRYRDLNIGLTDASIVILAARVGTNRILTLDERHFRAIRPISGSRSFKVLPADA